VPDASRPGLQVAQANGSRASLNLSLSQRSDDHRTAPTDDWKDRRPGDMAENENFDPFPSPDEPHEHAGGGGGDLPADFFDDVSEPSPVAMSARPAGEFEAASHAPIPSSVPAPPRPTPPPTEPPVSKNPIFPVIMGILMLGAVVGGVIASRKLAPEAPATPAAAPAATTTPADAPGAPAPAAATAPAPSPTDAPATQLKDIQAEFEGLSKSLKDLQAKVEGIAKSEPAPDLKPLETKVDGLAKTVAGLAPIGEKLDKLDERVGRLDEGLKTVQAEVSDLKDKVKKVVDDVAKAGAAGPKPAVAAAEGGEATPAAASPDAAISQGADLFKAGKYQEAATAFKKLQESNPKDARVYYYGALANGLTTNNWLGETERLVLKGVELEKAGTPATATIDSSFAGINPQLKPWLNNYRQRAR
jgi:archaellum component FlaC